MGSASNGRPRFWQYGGGFDRNRVVHNWAGTQGTGRASYIDSVALTDTHAGNWNAASSGTLATRRYQLQNWRADVVATTIDNGDPYEYIRYSPYGIPTSCPAADDNRNGVTNGTDTTDMIAVLGGGSAAVVCHIDLNKDGLYPDTADIDYCNDESALTGKRGGFNKFGTATGSVAPQRFGYAGYAWDPAIKVNHVRHRVYSPEIGKWLTRDPAGYIESQSLTEYALSGPLVNTDSLGLWTNWDFLHHYFTGRGRPIDLGTVGLLSNYINMPAVRDAVARAWQDVRPDIIAHGEELAHSVNCPFQRSITEHRWIGPSGTTDVQRLDFVNPNAYAWLLDRDIRFFTVDWTYSISGHILYYDLACRFYASCCENPFVPPGFRNWNAQCGMTLRMSDPFQDIFDIGGFFHRRRWIDVGDIPAFDRGILGRFSNPFNVTATFESGEFYYGLLPGSTTTCF